VSPTEIERKFLVCVLPDGLRDAARTDIEQGYLVAGEDGAEARLRRRSGRPLTLTVKRRHGLVRGEAEVALSDEQFEALWALTEGWRLRKTRYELPLPGGLLAEVDVYAGGLEGLVVCEVEFADEEQARAFAPPPWLGAEVTGEERYSNRSLAMHGLSEAVQGQRRPQGASGRRPGRAGSRSRERAARPRQGRAG
jgi:adenylate cyclase